MTKAARRGPPPPAWRAPRCQASVRSGKGGRASVRSGPRGQASVRSGQRGQASLELIGLFPVMVAIGLAFLQLLATGYAKVLAATAAEAGALALAAGGDARAGVREALPGWSRAGARVLVREGRVEVHLEPPSPLQGLGERLEVTGQASVEVP